MNILSNIFTKIKSLVVRGTWTPFDRIPLADGGNFGEVDNPYQNSVWVQRAIKEISGPISAVELCDEQTDELSPELEEYLKTPAVGLDFPSFVEASVGWLKLAGEVFYVLDDSSLVPFPEAKGIARLSKIIVPRPDCMTEVLDQGALVGWKFMDGNGKSIALLPEQVVHIKNWNPYNQYRGLSEYTAAKIATEADYNQGKFALNLARNNGDRGPYVIGKNGPVNDAQRMQIVAALREKRRKALNGEFSPVFLTGDIGIEDPKVSSLDTAFIAQRMENRHEIYIAFGVPPSMADLTQSYSIGAASDRYRLIEATCIPTSCKIASALSIVLSKLTGQSVKLEFDWDEHPVMQQVRRERIDSAIKLWNTGIPWKQVDEYLSLGLPEFEGKELARLPISLSSADMSMDPTTSPDYSEANPGDPVEEMKAALSSREFISDCGHFKSKDPKAISLWKGHMRARHGMVKLYQKTFNKVLEAAKQDVIANIERRNTFKSIEQKSASEFNFNLHTFKNFLFGEMKKAGIVCIKKAQNQFLDEIGFKNPFELPEMKVLQFVKSRENLLSGISDSIHAQVQSSLEEGIKSGATMKELVAGVTDEFNGISEGRAKTIAMTETTASYGYARNESMKGVGITHKQWITTGRPDVRPEHEAMNMRKVPIDEPFVFVDDKGFFELDYPGDPNGPPHLVINCHCVHAAAKGDDE